MSLIRTLGGISTPVGDWVGPTTAYDLPRTGPDYLWIPNPGLTTANGRNSIWYSFHIVFDAGPTAGPQWMYQFTSTAGSGGHAIHWNLGTDTLRYGGRKVTGGSDVTITSGYTPILGQRYHIVVGLDAAGSSAQLWVDGATEGPQSWNASGSSINLDDPGARCGFGNGGVSTVIANPDQQVDGYLTQFGAFDGFPSQDDVDNLANGEAPTTRAGCFAEYSLDPNAAGGGLDDTSGGGSPSLAIVGTLDTRPVV